MVYYSGNNCNFDWDNNYNINCHNEGDIESDNETEDNSEDETEDETEDGSEEDSEDETEDGTEDDTKTTIHFTLIYACYDPFVPSALYVRLEGIFRQRL